MCFSRPKVPEPQPVQQPPTQQDATVTKAATEAQRRARSAAGAQSTILTNDTQSVPLLGKTLLGQ